VRVRYGYRRLQVLLRRDGWSVNAKRIYRLYKEEGLVIRQKTPKRKRSCRYRGERAEISEPNQTWAMDFISDRLFDGRPFRILTIVDCHSRESLAIEPRGSFRAGNVVEALDRLARERGLPKTIRCDNWPEFAGRMLDQWAFFNQVELDFSRPATPTDNAYIESFNARLRQELLNASWLTSLAEAGACMEGWRKEYHEDRPHAALQNQTPKQYLDEARAAAKVA
jgi:putative transposase